MSRIYFIGDLSQKDAEILVEHSKTSKRILEFGVGGSTQLLSMNIQKGGDITCVDTSKKWIDKTKSNIELLKNNGFVFNANPNFIMYDKWKDHISGKYDIIFNDGIGGSRSEFAIASWKYLKVGGKMIFHDSKMTKQMNRIFELLTEVWNETANILTNPNDSNMTIITKKELQPYYNWNSKEGRKNWEFGSDTPPPNLWGEKI